MNSTPSTLALIMRLTALPPPPPTPITLILALLRASSWKEMRTSLFSAILFTSRFWSSDLEQSFQLCLESHGFRRRAGNAGAVRIHQSADGGGKLRLQQSHRHLGDGRRIADSRLAPQHGFADGKQA